MFALVVLGILQVSLAFQGDILIYYGILGALLYFFRNTSQKKLLITGIVLVIVQVLVGLGFALSLYMGETYSPDQFKLVASDIQRNTDTAFAVNAGGNFVDIASRRWIDWLSMLQYVFPLHGPGVFGFFLLGFAAVRAGVLADASAPLWHKSRKLYLPIGLLLSMVGAGIYMA